jgi:hypothetical protein
VQRFADVTIFQHQRRRAPVRDNAVVNVLVKEPAATEEAQALKKKPRPKEKWEAGSPSQEFSSPKVRNAPIPWW